MHGTSPKPTSTTKKTAHLDSTHNHPSDESLHRNDDSTHESSTHHKQTDYLEKVREHASKFSTSTLSPSETKLIQSLENASAIPFDLSKPTARLSDYPAAMKKAVEFLRSKHQLLCGYQCNQVLPYSKDFAPYLDMQVNNIGDAYTEGTFRLNTKFHERAVIRFISQLWGALVPSTAHEISLSGLELKAKDPTIERAYDESIDLSTLNTSLLTDLDLYTFFEQVWGYTLTMGSTEGNMYALRNGRDFLKGKFVSRDAFTNTDVNASTGSREPGSATHQPQFPRRYRTVFKQGEYNDQENTASIRQQRNRSTNPSDTVSTTSTSSTSTSASASASSPGDSTSTSNSGLEEPISRSAQQQPNQHNAGKTSETHGFTNKSTPYHPTDYKHIHNYHIPFQNKIQSMKYDASLHPSNPDHPQEKDRFQNNFDKYYITSEDFHHRRGHMSNAHRSRRHHAHRPHPHHDEHEPMHSMPLMRTCPILIYSEAAHYSITKIKDMLEIETPYTAGIEYNYNAEYVDLEGCRRPLPNQISIHTDGTVNVEELVHVCKFLTDKSQDRDHSLLIVCNYGTTFTGAHDPAHDIYRQLELAGCLRDTHWISPHSEEVIHPETGQSTHVHGKYTRPNYWLHVDGALGAFYGSLFDCDEMRQRWSREFKRPIDTIPTLPAFDFKPVDITLKPGQTAKVNPQEDIIHGKKFHHSAVMSISMSGHKMMGTPCPTGVVLTRHKFLLDAQTISYIGSADSTLAGSRNGLNGSTVWAYFAQRSISDHALKYLHVYDQTQYAIQKVQKALEGCIKKCIEKYGVHAHPSHTLSENERIISEQWKEIGQYSDQELIYNAPTSLSIIFPAPSQEIIEKFSLSRERRRFKGCTSHVPVVHIYIMEHMTKTLIDTLADALENDTTQLSIGKNKATEEQESAFAKHLRTVLYNRQDEEEICREEKKRRQEYYLREVENLHSHSSIPSDVISAAKSKKMHADVEGTKAPTSSQIHAQKGRIVEEDVKDDTHHTAKGKSK